MHFYILSFLSAYALMSSLISWSMLNVFFFLIILSFIVYQLETDSHEKPNLGLPHTPNQNTAEVPLIS